MVRLASLPLAPHRAKPVRRRTMKATGPFILRQAVEALDELVELTGTAAGSTSVLLRSATRPVSALRDGDRLSGFRSVGNVVGRVVSPRPVSQAL